MSYLYSLAELEHSVKRIQQPTDNSLSPPITVVLDAKTKFFLPPYY